MSGEIQRLRAALEDVKTEHQRQRWHPHTHYPTDYAKAWHNGYITCAATFAIKARAALDPEGSAEDDETWQISNHGTDLEWWQRTGHCGRCGIVASSCDCDGECGCWETHGPPLTPWKSLPALLEAAEAKLAAIRAICDEPSPGKPALHVTSIVRLRDILDDEVAS